MGRKERKKRKKSDTSLNSSENNDSVYKAGRYTSTPEQTCVSTVLKEVNSVLFCNIDETEDSDKSLQNLFSQTPANISNMSTPPSQESINVNNDQGTGGSPSNADLLTYLKKIDNRIGGMEKRLDKLDDLEKKMGSFEKELNKLWSRVQDQNKKADERLTAVEEKVESADFNQGVANEKLIDLEKENSALKEDLVYLKSQSMRNNLVFANIEEAPSGVHENTEAKLKEFLESKMKLAKEQVERMAFERVHRMGPIKQGIARKVVAKFTLFKERELVRKQWKALDGTQYYVHEQFPKEVIAKRRQLVPKMKEAKKSGKNAWISYDTLYIDGKAQRNEDK